MIKRVVLLMAFALVLTSCTIRFDSNTVVRDDGSGTLALEFSFDEEFRQFMEEGGGAGEFELTDDLSDVPPGWTATPFTRGEWEGVRITVDFSDLEDLDNRLAELDDSTGNDQTTPTFIQTSGLSKSGSGFEFRLVLEDLEESISDAGSAGEGSDFDFDGFDPAAIFGEIFEIRYLLTLPGEITNHNADEISGNTLTWNIALTDNGRELRATSSGGGGGGIPLLAILAIIAGAVVAFVLYQARNRRVAYQSGWKTMGDDTTPPVAPVGAPESHHSGDPFAAPASNPVED